MPIEIPENQTFRGARIRSKGTIPVQVWRRRRFVLAVLIFLAVVTGVVSAAGLAWEGSLGLPVIFHIAGDPRGGVIHVQVGARVFIPAMLVFLVSMILIRVTFRPRALRKLVWAAVWLLWASAALVFVASVIAVLNPDSTMNTLPDYGAAPFALLEYSVLLILLAVVLLVTGLVSVLIGWYRRRQTGGNQISSLTTR